MMVTHAKKSSLKQLLASFESRVSANFSMKMQHNDQTVVVIFTFFHSTQLNSMPHGMKNEKNGMKQNKTMKVKKMK
jgi:hypothetical protein